MPDPNEYPTDEELKRITAWPLDPLGWFAFIKLCWWAADWGWIETKGFCDGGTKITVEYLLSTGGWSGNESIIDAMQDNRALWLLTWYSSRRGGHFVFRVPSTPAPAPRAVCAEP